MTTSMMHNFVLAAFALCATAAAAEVYSWKDADGKTHFSDTPPAGKEPSLKTIVLPPNGTGTAQPKPVVRERKAPVATSPAPSKTANEDTAAQTRRATCEKAKADLQTLDDRPRRTAVGKGGRSFALDGEERAEEETDLQKLIDANCN